MIHQDGGNDPDITQCYGLPKKILNAYGLKGYQPQDESDANYYGHSEAVTCFSQVLLETQGICQNTCHLEIGRWSNYVEILIAGGIATFTPRSTDDVGITRFGLGSSGLDLLRKTTLIRRSVEEWASATGMAEYVLNPRLFPRSAGGVEAHITGGGNDPCIVTLKVWASTCIGRSSVTWRWNSNYKRSVPLAPNHRRLSSNVYQTDYTQSFRTLDLPPRNYVCNNTIGSRGYGWAHLRGAEPRDDYEIEKFLSRLDYHKVPEWGYYQWPDGNVIRSGSYRVTSTLTAELATSAGWNGFNDSYKGIWGWGVDYMKTDLRNEILSTLAIRPMMLSRATACVFVSGLWQSIGIGVDASIETTGSIVDRMRGFALAAQHQDGTFENQLEQVLALPLPTRSDGTSSAKSTTQLLTQSQATEAANMRSHYGVLPPPMPSSNPMAGPNLGTSQSNKIANAADQTIINNAIPPTLKTGTDGATGLAADNTLRSEVA